MNESNTKRRGHVCLVGAGPGDGGLLTVRGRERLQRAEVVIYDALVGADLLDLVAYGAELIDVGKRAGAHKLAQEKINALMVEKARQGLFVVRLKGGDPYMFGRGAEEAAYLAEHGIGCEVVPGLTAAVALPGSAGIALTHRKVASTVTFATGHEDPAKSESSVDYQALAGLIKAGGTVCFYMGINRLSAIAKALMDEGITSQMPTAVVQWVTTSKQKSVRTTLAKAQEAVEQAGLWAPSIIVVGEVVSMEIQGSKQALLGKTVVITRQREQAGKLYEQLCGHGARVVEAPTIEIHPPADLNALDRVVASAAEYDWLILTSANGVDALVASMDRRGIDSRHFAGVKFAVVGNATAAALHDCLRIGADIIPKEFVADALADELIEHHAIKGKRLLLLRGDIARAALPQQLAEAGAVITEAITYQTQCAAELPADVLDLLRKADVDWMTFTSASTARNMFALLGDERQLMQGVKIASIGPVTTQAIIEAGFAPAIEAEVSTIVGLVDAMVKAQEGGK